MHFHRKENDSAAAFHDSRIVLRRRAGAGYDYAARIAVANEPEAISRADPKLRGSVQ
jgi:hypothetical protein